MKNYAYTIFMTMCVLLAGSWAHAQQIPDVTLPDPQGGKHHLPTLAKTGGLVLVITSPTLDDKSAQEAWSKLLASARGSNQGTFVMVEEMKDAFIKSIALHQMKENWKPGDVPLLLVDNSSTLHAKLDVRKDETVVLAYNSKGVLVKHYTGAPSKPRAKAIWAAVD
ncbi:MAG: hypothetical protein R6U38_10755 [Desulfatiglandaceae bacterium]